MDINGKIVLANLTADPVADETEGMLYYNSTSKKLKYYDGSEWKEMGGLAVVDTFEDGVYDHWTGWTGTEANGQVRWADGTGTERTVTSDYDLKGMGNVEFTIWLYADEGSNDKWARCYLTDGTNEALIADATSSSDSYHDDVTANFKLIITNTSVTGVRTGISRGSIYDNAAISIDISTWTSCKIRFKVRGDTSPNSAMAGIFYITRPIEFY